MAAIYYFLVFLDLRNGGNPRRERRPPWLRPSWAALASALANLAFLNMLMSLWVFVLFFSCSKANSSLPRTAAGSLPASAGRPRRERG